MSADLVAFLRARLDEDEAVARAATRGPWTWKEYRGDLPYLTGRGGAPGGYEYETEVVEAEHFGECGCRSACHLELKVSERDRAHIARHDPARVLRQVEAGRQIIAEAAYYLDTCGDEDVQVHATHTLESLAAIYRDHEDYREEWAL